MRFQWECPCLPGRIEGACAHIVPPKAFSCAEQVENQARTFVERTLKSRYPEASKAVELGTPKNRLPHAEAHVAYVLVDDVFCVV